MMSILSKHTSRSFNFVRKVAPNVMSLTQHNNLPFVSSVKPSLLPKNSFLNNFRPFSLSLVNRSEEEEDDDDDDDDKPKKIEKVMDPSKDRRTPKEPEVSIRYMNSAAYRTTYGDDPVWTKYRRNFKGQYQPKKTRRTCIKSGYIASGNPCPICRDEYLVLHYTNLKLLNQFISPHTGKVYEPTKSGLCREKQFQLEVAIEKAQNYGYITYQVPFREYDYNEFYENVKDTNSSS